MNVEKDEAGRLAAFRNKFGRSFDASNAGAAGAAGAGAEVEASAEKGKEGEAAVADAAAADAAAAEQAAEAEAEEEEDYLLDLISTFGQEQDPQLSGGRNERKRRG